MSFLIKCHKSLHGSILTYSLSWKKKKFSTWHDFADVIIMWRCQLIVHQFSFLSLKTRKNQLETAYGNSIILYAAILITLLNWKIRKLIQKTILKENITGEQMIWLYIKYEIRKFCISFSKQYALKINEPTHLS